MHTTLLCRTEEQRTELDESRETRRYLPGVALPRDLKVRTLGTHDDQFHRADLVFLAVPSKGLAQAVVELERQGVGGAGGRGVPGKGTRPARRAPPRWPSRWPSGPSAWRASAGRRTRRDGHPGAGLVCASHSERLAPRFAELFQRAGVVCEVSDDPVGVELAGCVKNAAAVAVGATEAQGLNSAGMAAGDMMSEVAALAERRGGQARTFLAARAQATWWPSPRPEVAQPERGRAARPGRSRRGDPGAAGSGGRSARDSATAGAGMDAPA